MSQYEEARAFYREQSPVFTQEATNSEMNVIEFRIEYIEWILILEKCQISRHDTKKKNAKISFRIDHDEIDIWMDRISSRRGLLKLLQKKIAVNILLLVWQAFLPFCGLWNGNKNKKAFHDRQETTSRCNYFPLQFDDGPSPFITMWVCYCYSARGYTDRYLNYDPNNECVQRDDFKCFAKYFK